MDQVELTPVRERNPRVSKRVAEAVEKALQVHPNNRWQMAAEFKNELRKAQSGRFTINFGLDQAQGSKAPKPAAPKTPEIVVHGVETKDLDSKPQGKGRRTGAKKKGTARGTIKLDRGGCLGLIGLLALIFFLAAAVFALLNPTLARGLLAIWF
jgi:hypothetical protein